MNVFRFMLQNHTQVLELTLEHLRLVGVSTLLAMLIGIISGTYSSIFNASCLLVSWQNGDFSRLFRRGRGQEAAA